MVVFSYLGFGLLSLQKCIPNMAIRIEFIMQSYLEITACQFVHTKQTCWEVSHSWKLLPEKPIIIKFYYMCMVQSAPKSIITTETWYQLRDAKAYVMYKCLICMHSCSEYLDCDLVLTLLFSSCIAYWAISTTSQLNRSRNLSQSFSYKADSLCPTCMTMEPFSKWFSKNLDQLHQQLSTLPACQDHQGEVKKKKWHPVSIFTDSDLIGLEEGPGISIF